MSSLLRKEGTSPVRGWLVQAGSDFSSTSVENHNRTRIGPLHNEIAVWLEAPAAISVFRILETSCGDKAYSYSCSYRTKVLRIAQLAALANTLPSPEAKQNNSKSSSTTETACV
jgi:streptogramin lyase